MEWMHSHLIENDITHKEFNGLRLNEIETLDSWYDFGQPNFETFYDIPGKIS